MHCARLVCREVEGHCARVLCSYEWLGLIETLVKSGAIGKQMHLELGSCVMGCEGGSSLYVYVVM